MAPHASHHRQGLTGFWIAFADDRETVLGKGKTAQEALKNAQKKSPETLIITHVSPDDDEIPNDDLIAAMKEAEEEDRQGKLQFYSTAEEFMASLE
jgi:ribonuclease BN (tRNA processing enzyme)